MASQKIVSLFWTIVFISCEIFSVSNAFSSLTSIKRALVSSSPRLVSSTTPGPPSSVPAESPSPPAPSWSPIPWTPAESPSAPAPSWSPKPWKPAESPFSWPPLDPPAASPAPSRLAPFTPSSPSPWSQPYPPVAPPAPAKFTPSTPPPSFSMPPYPATNTPPLPYPMPPSPSPMPSTPPPPFSMPPYPATNTPPMSYPLPPSPSPMPSTPPPPFSMPPYPATNPPSMPYPMPPSPSPMPSTPPPPFSMPPYPATNPPPIPYPTPPSPSPMPSTPPPPFSMPPYPATNPPPIPYPTLPSPSPMPSTPPPTFSMPPYPATNPPPMRSSVPPSPMPSPVPTSNGIKGGYWPKWLAQKLPPSTIPTIHFTHLFYAFVSLDPSSYQLYISQPDDQWMKNFTATLHTQTPPAKALLSIGGGDSSTQTFSNMASNPDHRASFIKSTVQIAREYGFDGLDLDWEFPSTKEDMSNLALLFKQWREYIDQESKSSAKPRLLISAAVYFSPDFLLSNVPRSYPGFAIRSYVDFVNTLNFDYHGSWDTSATAEHALLYDNSSRISTSYGMDAWPVAGVLPEKLVMGLPLYGRTWKLKNPEEHGIGAPAVGVGPGENGVMGYNEIVEYNWGNGATVVYDNVTVSTYSYKGTDWIGYDGPSSVSGKIEYAKRMELAGYFFWVLGSDRDWELAELASITWDD